MECILDWTRINLLNTKQLPCEPGCYALIKESEIWYIGRSKLLWSRLSRLKSHNVISKVDPKEFELAWKTGWEIYEKEKELILKYKPRLCTYYLK